MGKDRSEPSLAQLRSSRRWTEEEARYVIAAWRASGESVREFARQEGLVAQRVYWWRDRLDVHGAATAVESGAATRSMPALVPVTIRAAAEATTRAAVTVCLREGVRVEVAELGVTSAAWVAALARCLEESGA